MARTRVPAEVKDFVARYLPSIEHLEVFMVLHRTPSRSWSPSDIATEVRIPEETAADVLERLASDNFLDIKISNDILYRYNPARDDLRTSADRCAEIWARERIAMMNLVMTAGLGPIRDFAEAFRIKKDKGDG